MTLTRTTAPLNAYVHGALVLTDQSGRTLRVPISVKPIQIATPTRISLSTAAAAGNSTFTVKPGYTGQLSALGWGLAAPTVNAGKRISATTGNPNPERHRPRHPAVPGHRPVGAQLLSARLSNVDNGNASSDLDLFVYRDPNADGNYSDAQLVGYSAGPTAIEDVTLPLPAAGNYAVAVVGFATQTGGSVYDLSTWVVNDASPDDPSNPPGLTVTGDGAVTTGVAKTLTLNWSGAAAKGLYLGVVTYHATNAPTTGNIAAVSVVELNKTADTAPSGQSDTGGEADTTPIGQPDANVITPAAQPAPQPAAPAPARRRRACACGARRPRRLGDAAGGADGAHGHGQRAHAHAAPAAGRGGHRARFGDARQAGRGRAPRRARSRPGPPG